METIHSFDPIINHQSKILILGTMPGKESLKKQQYYGNERNQFWRILYTLFGVDLVFNYEQRKKFLLERRIALWDVIDNCTRMGSLDSDIKFEKVNDFTSIFSKYKNLEKVFFNGKKAQDIYERKIGIYIPGIVHEILPSTSPAFTIGFTKKIESWQKILELLL
jgi:TDG/mug DNA glycosylase family protein